MVRRPILKETTLAAIVRDEAENPADGVEAWLRATLPYVGRAVVVDTGSVDGTRDILTRLTREFSHLKVYDRAFDDFASSRNFSLGKVNTKRALVLDADELILPEEYARLVDYMLEYPQPVYHFNFKLVYPTSVIMNTFEGQATPRLFDVKGARYANGRRGGFYEDVCLQSNEEGFVPSSCTVIKHFMPSDEALTMKKLFWYERRDFKAVQPIEHARQYGWKERNGGRSLLYNSEEKIREFFPELVES